MNKMMDNIALDKDNNILNIGKGCLISIIITLILLFVFSALLTYTNLSESLIAPVIIIITGVSILIGSQISSRKIKKNGILNGGIIGLIYIMLLYIISSIVGSNFSLNFYSIIMILASIVSGMLGGIIGVNIK